MQKKEYLCTIINNLLTPMKMKRTFILLCLAAMPFMSQAQEMLSTLDFFYAGQSKNRRMFIVKDGKVVWSYDDPSGKGEISDAVLMTDGHILMAQQYSIREIDRKKNIVWEMEAPQGTEIHTIQPIGKNHVVYVRNGHPAKAIIAHIPDMTTIREFDLPCSEKGSVHGQFRNAHLTSKGTLLVANMAMNFVAEYDETGRELNRWELFGPWSASELSNGNYIMVGRKGPVKEINAKGETVWEISTTDYGATQPQKAYRLKNGNTVISNWFNEWDKVPVDLSNPPVQAIEISRDKKLVRTLSSWVNPNLGPATTIQPLTQIVNRKKCHFGKIK